MFISLNYRNGFVNTRKIIGEIGPEISQTLTWRKSRTEKTLSLVKKIMCFYIVTESEIEPYLL